MVGSGISGIPYRVRDGGLTIALVIEVSILPRNFLLKELAPRRVVPAI